MARTPKHIQRKWQVCYRDERGGYGVVGYILFDTKEAAEAWGNDFMKRTAWVSEIMIKHPAPIFSNY